jgi:hypothetical protein
MISSQAKRFIFLVICECSHAFHQVLTGLHISDIPITCSYIADLSINEHECDFLM